MTSSSSDIVQNSMIFRLFPPFCHPYLLLMRLDRPVGWQLLALPCLLSLTLDALTFNLTYIWYAGLFIVGAILMRGAGCVINDMTDRTLDKKVARTRNRPLVSGAVSLKNAYLFLGVLLLISLIILLQFNLTVIILSFCVVPLVVLYPWMKRWTYWPQAFLGIVFNWGAFLGGTAYTGTVSEASFLLFIGGIFWTLGYDTIYAHQDKEDDLLIGIKSTALLFGAKTKPILTGCYVLMTLFWAAALFQAVGNSWIALGYAAILGCLALRLLHSVEWDEALSCRKAFKANVSLGLWSLLLFLIIRWLPSLSSRTCFGISFRS